MPAHEVYIEAFAGDAAILQRKRPAPASIVIERDEDQAVELRRVVAPGVLVVCGDAISYLRRYPFVGHELLYCDPPYVLSTRGGRRIYRCELGDAAHVALIELLASLPCAVMLSGYRSSLYDARLQGWRRIDYQARTRGRTVTESLWLNFPAPAVPWDARYLGSNFRERERIKRMRERWRARFAKLSPAERAALLALLVDPATPLLARGSTGGLGGEVGGGQSRHAAAAPRVGVDGLRGSDVGQPVGELLGRGARR